MTLTAILEPKGPRFSGHESFACRYAWLPKACMGLAANSRLFVDEDLAMVELGIGKNMVRSLRFWVEAMGLAAPDAATRSLKLTPFAKAVFGEKGLDPYLEDERTLWLLHWHLASKDSAPLFAWDFLINQWPKPEFTRSEALLAFRRESEALGHDLSEVTLGQHLDVFLHTYLPGRSPFAEESLDGPLVQLQLLQVVGERRLQSGRWEPVYGFRREAKPGIAANLFDYCVLDFARRQSSSDRTVSFRSVALMPRSPGQVFKLPEADVRTRLEDRAGEGRGYTYQASAVQGQLTLLGAGGPTLKDVYRRSVRA